MSLFKKESELSRWAVSTRRKPTSLSRAKVVDMLTVSAGLVGKLLDIGELGKKERYALAFKLAGCYMQLTLKKTKMPISTLAEHYDGGSERRSAKI